VKKLAGFVFKRLGDLTLGILCVAALATFGGKLFWLFDLASHFQVYYFAAAVVLLVGNLFLKRRTPALLSLVLVGLGIFHLYPYLAPVTKKTAASDGKGYTVMHLNLNLLNQRTAAVKRAIADADPDLLVLQETTPRWHRELESIGKGYRHNFSIPESGAFGIWVMSKFELVDLDVQRRGDIPFLHIRYKVDGQELEIVALHPMPPVGRQATRSRNDLLEGAAVYAAGEGNRIAVGDFNCSPWSPNFRSFLKKSGLRDSARGRGLPSTWFPIPLIGIPIDHVLVSPEIQILDRRVGGDVGSDHRAVIVEFRIGG
jgi:endonuclease/exonuclease/phosphatase (EEP) superfamily protein YafD